MEVPCDWNDIDNSELQAHIWHYNPDGSSWNGAEDIPMRIAITFHCPNKVEKEVFHSTSIRSILKITGLVPSLPQYGHLIFPVKQQMFRLLFASAPSSFRREISLCT